MGIVQEAFYIHGRIANMWHVERIQKMGGTWLLFPPKKYLGKSQLIPFPPPCVKTEEEEKALLAFGHCHIALVSQHSLIRSLIQGMFKHLHQGVSGADTVLDFCKEMLEVGCHVKNQRIRLGRVYGNGIVDGTDYVHHVVKITLKNGAQYALDMTGAQYGWSESIMPWDTYKATRIQSITKTSPFGNAKDELHAKFKIHNEWGTPQMDRRDIGRIQAKPRRIR